MTTKNQQEIELQSNINIVQKALDGAKGTGDYIYTHQLRSAMEALITAATSKRSEVPEWLPIESAPADTLILMACFKYGTWFYQTGRDGNMQVGMKATHWQPIKAPKSTAQAEREG